MKRIGIDSDQAVTRGALTLFPLIGGNGSARAYVTGPEAAERNLFDVFERANGAVVPELEVENRSPLPLLLLEGEILTGAQQNRTLNVSVLCTPLGRTVIPVSCVEAGRWGRTRKSGRGRVHSTLAVRAAKTRSVNEELRRTGTRRSDQSSVWEEIDTLARKHRRHSPTSALDEVQDQLAGEIQSIVSDLRPATGQRGVVVGIGGRVRSFDLFDKPETLIRYWNALLAGYASDALGEKAVPTSAVAAKRFVAKVLRAPVRHAAAVGIGTEAHVESERLAGISLEWDGELVHMSAFALS
jgi:hypothetical protein